MKGPQSKPCGNPNCTNTFLQYNSLQNACSPKCSEIIREIKRQGKTGIEKVIAGTMSGNKIGVLKMAFDMRSKDITELQHAAKNELQTWVKYRDISEGCISCPAVFQMPGDWHGGHCFKAETHSGVELDECNVHKQCRRCNIDLHGNKAGFIAGIIERYGQEYFDRLEEKANRTRVHVWEVDVLIEIKKAYRRKNIECRKINS